MWYFVLAALANQYSSLVRILALVFAASLP